MLVKYCEKSLCTADSTDKIRNQLVCDIAIYVYVSVGDSAYFFK